MFRHVSERVVLPPSRKFAEGRGGRRLLEQGILDNPHIYIYMHILCLKSECLKRGWNRRYIRPFDLCEWFFSNARNFEDSQDCTKAPAKETYAERLLGVELGFTWTRGVWFPHRIPAEKRFLGPPGGGKSGSQKEIRHLKGPESRATSRSKGRNVRTIGF